MNRLSKVRIKWSPAFAYAIGLITTDGNLSPDGRHINFTSKDKDLAESFKNCLNLSNKIGEKSRGGSKEKKYFVVQFGDRNFYDFLLSVGLKPAKSKTLRQLLIPRDFFRDFLRGCIDGDGNISYVWHPESRHPQLRIRLFSASPPFLKWIKSEVAKILNTKTGWIETKYGISTLIYAKSDSLKLIDFLYQGAEHYLKRKYRIVEEFFGRVAELV